MPAAGGGGTRRHWIVNMDRWLILTPGSIVQRRIDAYSRRDIDDVMQW